MRRAQILRLIHRFAMTEAQASALVNLIWGTAQ